jgi:light-harvesting complex I chlorophyll a/b binding protein 1
MTSLNAEKSPAMPFLPYPENLKGYIGDDIGFDPLGISNYFPMDYMRESEIKHGRIAMLAVVGFITTDLGIIIHPYGKGLTSVTAHDVLADKKVMGNILLFMCLFEIVSYIAVSEMLQGSGREPGYFGFGTKYYEGKSEEQIKKLKYNEIMNGRLAMLAFGGMVTQSVLYDKGFPYF